MEVTALYDGIWKKPHDAAFIKNASIDETKAAREPRLRWTPPAPRRDAAE